MRSFVCAFLALENGIDCKMHFSYCCSRDKCTNYKERESEREEERERENNNERDSLSRRGEEYEWRVIKLRDWATYTAASK